MIEFYIFNISDSKSIIDVVSIFLLLGCSSSLLIWACVQGVCVLRSAICVVGDEV